MALCEEDQQDSHHGAPREWGEDGAGVGVNHRAAGEHSRIRLCGIEDMEVMPSWK